MINKWAFAGVIFLLFISNLHLSAQFECESEETSYLLKKNKATIISNDCSSTKCIGKIIWEDGTNYSGSINNGKMNGKGTLEVPNQYQYEGEFKDGKKEGTGKIIFDDGASYDGEWKDDKKNGFGAFVFPCGFEYLGDFKNDKMHGEGSLRMDKTESFSGTWEAGLIQGQGTHFRKDGSQFTGEYKNGEPNGKGMIVWESKDTMKGTWNNGIIDDLSHFQFENGSAIIQHWEKGKIQQKTIYVQENGFNVSGAPDELAKLLLNSSLSNNKSVEDNFSLAWYVVAMEYKNQNDFEGATEQLKFAQIFLDPFEETRLSSLLELEMENITLEKERTGVAQKVGKDESSQ